MSRHLPWKVLHLELSARLPALPSDADVQGYYLVLWWHGLPLGHLMVAAEHLPMPASQLLEKSIEAITPTVYEYLLQQEDAASSTGCLMYEALTAEDAPLARLRDRARAEGAPALSVSVVVCTRDRPESLRRCLHALRRLSWPPHEILVVDNAPSTDATRRLVAEMPGVGYVLEPRAGLSGARNAGVRHSTGDVVAFTDDDAVVHPDWLFRLLHGFRDPAAMAVTGLVVPAALDTEAQFLFETCWGFNRGYVPRTFDAAFFAKTGRWGAPVWDIGAGANMAVRRDAFDLVGGFDERLGAGASGCSEDSEFWYRVLAEGGSCRYEPTAVVYHEHRRNNDDFKRQVFYYMRGHAAALLVQFEKYRHRGNLRRLLVTLPRQYAGLCARGLRHGFKGRYGTLPAELSGCLSGVRFYVQHRRTAGKQAADAARRGAAQPGLTIS